MGDVGLFLGSSLSFALCFVPVIYIDTKGIKIKQPKPLFVEPKLWKGMIAYLIGCILTSFLFVLVISFEPLSTHVGVLIDKDGFWGNIIMSFGIFTALLAPISVYMLFVRLRYREVVEYGTPRWRKLNSHGRERKSHIPRVTVCNCAIGEKGSYNILVLIVQMFFHILFLLTVITAIFDKNLQSLPLILILLYGMLAWDFWQDRKRYLAENHSASCSLRRALLNAFYRYKGLSAPGDK